MSRHTIWAILAPGELAWVESRAHDTLILEDEEELPLPFEIVPGRGRYHAILGLDDERVGVEMDVAQQLSLECDGPVYSFECAKEPWNIMSFRNGIGKVEEERTLESLAMSLDCPLPDDEESSNRPQRKPLRSVALLEGVQAQEARRLLEEIYGEPLIPEAYRFVDTPRGLLLAGGIHDLGFAHINLSERLPHATVYGVTASPSLDFFAVQVMRGAAGIGEFVQPPHTFPSPETISEIKGESSPERILAALGIPAEWFQNE